MSSNISIPNEHLPTSDNQIPLESPNENLKTNTISFMGNLKSPFILIATLFLIFLIIFVGEKYYLNTENKQTNFQVNKSRVSIIPTPFITPTIEPKLTTVSKLKDYYISNTGNDTNPGTKLQPFATINKANSLVTPGDTVHVMPGTYNQNILLTRSGTENQRIIYKSEVRGEAKIIGNGVTPLFATWENTGNSYIEIDGFDVSGGGRFGILNYNGAHNIIIIQNHVHNIAVGYCTNLGGDGIGSTENGNPHDNDYIANIVESVSVSTKPCSYVHGFYVQGLRERILNNLIINNAGIGVACTHACNEPTISNNTIVNNGYGIRIGWSSVLPGKTNNAIISNNIIMNNNKYALYEYLAGMGSNNQLLNNLIYGNNPNTCSASDCVNTKTADPLFVKYLGNINGDFHLQTLSPAINSGTSIRAPTTDFDGVSRPQSTNYDIGAFEFK
jgi:hypothetical protein